MDFHKQGQEQFQAMGMCAQLCVGFCALIYCGVAITLVVYLGIFALDNPNAEGWYGEVSDVPTMNSESWFASQDQAKVANLDDVHSHFVTWFLWGFINAIGTIGPMLLFCIPCCPPIAACFQCSGCAWWIAGMVWRLRQSGSFASGDIMPANATEEDWIAQITADGSMYQYESGKFMWIYYMITWIIMGISCLCSCCVGIAGAFKG
jgi:hypothetical protein